MKLAGLHKSLRPLLVGVAAAGLATGLVAGFAGHSDWARSIWTVTTLPVLAALVGEIITSLRRGDLGLDIVAALSMSAALVFGQELAAAVVALMYSGGQYLELFAERRARREMTALLERVPRAAMRHRDGGLEEVPLEAISPGDRLLVRHGDVVPVDGEVIEGVAVLDEVRPYRRGDARPTRHRRGDHERPDECGRRLRRDGEETCRREHLRRHRPAGRAGAAV